MSERSRRQSEKGTVIDKGQIIRLGRHGGRKRGVRIYNVFHGENKK